MPILHKSLTHSRRRNWYVPSIALILWICLWLNLNTGFWNFHAPQNPSDFLNVVRAALPFVALPAAGLVLIHRRKLRLPKGAPSRLLFAYGCFSTLAALFSPQPLWALYWSIAFLATILVAWTFVNQKNPLDSARQLLRVSWVATFVVAAIIGYQARGVVFSSATNAYSVLSTLNGLSRASGVARWAAIPGLVCLVRAYYSRGFSRIVFYLGTAAVCFFIIYRMQSRGAVFGSAAALMFALLISSKMRRYALPFAMLAFIVIVTLESPEMLSDRIITYLMRGQSQQQFLSMTGRTRAYRHSIEAIEDAPVFGRGQWADRLIIGEHSHNSFLQALLNGGLLGGIPYFGSWITGWLLFYKLQKRNARLAPVDRVHLLECGTVMMFFTVRAIPETTTASFAVDLLVMAAVYVYLESLFLQTGLERVRGMIRPYAVVPYWVTQPPRPARVGAYRPS